MTSVDDRNGLMQLVRQALRHLYEPTVLCRSGLHGLLGLAPDATALRGLLVSAIEALRPSPGVSPQSHAWRTYHVLTQRYVQQFSQSEVATDLGLSVRQLQRQERIALGELAGYLRQHLAPSHGTGDGPVEGERAAAVGPDGTTEQEMAWLRSYPSQYVPASEVVQTAWRAAEALLARLAVRVEVALPSELPSLQVQVASAPQALLGLITAGAHAVPGGRLRIEAEQTTDQVAIVVSGYGAAARVAEEGECAPAEDLEVARQLALLSHGMVEVAPACPPRLFLAKLLLPTAERVAVLIIEDNLDTLRLFERYLAESKYAWFGASDLQQALQKADQVSPRVVVLDVMLPGTDGWELLGWLRERPSIRGRPIVVCTILPQEHVALSLGASAFLRKPFTRQQLLALLDRLTGRALESD